MSHPAQDPPFYPLDSAPSRSTEPSHTLEEKYSHLKKRYFELAGKQEDAQRGFQAELQKSMDLNSKLRSERSLILNRVIELESRLRIYEGHLQQVDPAFLAQQPDSNSGHPPFSAAGAFPKALLSQNARAAFVANLHQAMREIDTEDRDADDAATTTSIPARVFPQAAQPSVPSKRRAEDTVSVISSRTDRERDDTKRSRRGREAVADYMPQSAGRSASPGAPPSLPAAPGSRNGRGNGFVSDYDENQRNGEADRFGDRDQHDQLRSGSPRPASNGTNHRLVVRPPRQEHELIERGQLRVDADARDLSHKSISHSPLSPPLPHPSHTKSTPSHDSRPPVSPTVTSAASSFKPLLSLPPPPSAMVSNTRGAPRPSDAQRFTKPKRLKAHTVTSKSFSIPTVPRDPATGRPKLPLNVGIMTVISLGEICPREHFHTERYIFPIGYSVTRRYLSTRDPNADVSYHCTIMDGGEGPTFQIIAQDCPEPIYAGTATGAWSRIIRKANEIRKRQHSNSVSGPDYFGLGQNTIKHLIQELPGVDRLRNYVKQTFVEGGPLGGRHAAVVPAGDYESASISTPTSLPNPSVVMPPPVDVRFIQDDHASPPAEELYDQSPPGSGKQNHYNGEYESRRGAWRQRSHHHRPESPVSSVGSGATSPIVQREPSPPPPPSKSHQRAVSRSAQSYVRTQSPGTLRERDVGTARTRLSSIVHDFASPPTGTAPLARA